MKGSHLFGNWWYFMWFLVIFWGICDKITLLYGCGFKNFVIGSTPSPPCWDKIPTLTKNDFAGLHSLFPLRTHQCSLWNDILLSLAEFGFRPGFRCWFLPVKRQTSTISAFPQFPHIRTSVQLHSSPFLFLIYRSPSPASLHFAFISTC